MSILCFGSANIDDTYRVPHMVARGETLAATSVVRCAGGKGLNQAIALARRVGAPGRSVCRLRGSGRRVFAGRA